MLYYGITIDNADPINKDGVGGGDNRYRVVTGVDGESYVEEKVRVNDCVIILKRPISFLSHDQKSK